MTRGALGLVLACAIAPAFAQQPTPPTSPATLTLRGIVTADNGAVLPRVRILAAASQPIPAVISDDRGRFALEIPDAASVRVTLIKAGYASATREIPRAQLVAAAGGDWRVTLARGAVITGQVLDQTGEPVIGAPVVARLVDSASTLPPEVLADTNDLGEFRLAALPAGTFMVTAGSARSTPADVKNALAPANRGAGAVVSAGGPGIQTVTVSPGDEVATLPFTVEAPSELTQLAGGRTPDPDLAAAGIIRGRLTGPTGRPIARALVRATRPGMPLRAVETDAQGRYRITNLPPGDYLVEARKSGYVARQYGQERVAQGGRVVAVRNDAAAEGIDVMLPRGSVITGTIVDEFGEPLQGVRVDVLQLQFVAGRTRGVRVATVREQTTDDRGQYRLFGLLPGSYLVRANVDGVLANSPGQGYLPVFHPGVADLELASRVELEIGRDAPGVDLTFAPAPASRVTGSVVDSAGRPVPWVGIVLVVSERSGRVQTEPQKSNAAADGGFEFPNVAPGDYVVQAFTGNPSSGMEFATAYVTVTGGDPPPVVLRTSPGATLSGRVTFEGLDDIPVGTAGPAVSLQAMQTDFDRAPLVGVGSSGFSLAADRTFTYRGLTGPRRLILQGRESGWYLKSVVIRGGDVTDTPFDFGLEPVTISDAEVVISTSGATLSGHVTDGRLAAVSDYAVVVYSTDSARWFAGSRSLKLARPSQDGGFRVSGLPPGEYWMVAVDRIDGLAGAGEWQDPEPLAALSSRAMRVTLGEGEARAVGLRLVMR